MITKEKYDKALKIYFKVKKILDDYNEQEKVKRIKSGNVCRKSRCDNPISKDGLCSSCYDWINYKDEDYE